MVYCSPGELKKAVDDAIAIYNRTSHESLNNVPPDDVYAGRKEVILQKRREKKRFTMSGGNSTICTAEVLTQPMPQTSINVQTRFEQKCPKRSQDIQWLQGYLRFPPQFPVTKGTGLAFLNEHFFHHRNQFTIV